MKLEAIRCTIATCRCDCFSPGKSYLRTCETCQHGWVIHALDKLGHRSIYQAAMPVEVVQPNIVFDIASLMLYGSQATPIRLKILLDRLFSVLQHEEVLQVLHGFGWTYEDYARGYILQDSSGRVLDKWNVATRDEEHLIIQQFLRFGETKSIAQDIILKDARDGNRTEPGSLVPQSESEIKKFLERSSLGMQSFIKGYEPRPLVPRLGAFPVSSTSPASSKLLSPPGPAVGSFSPGPTGASTPKRSESSGSMLLPVTVSTASPIKAASPLGHLQTMQPFDFRRGVATDAISPAMSPMEGERSLPTPPQEETSPQNLSLAAAISSSRATPPNLMVPKPELTSIEKLTPTSTSTSSSLNTSMEEKDDDLSISPEGAINYSTKDNPSLAASPNSAYGDAKVKHLRKSTNPMKRSWTPTPGYGGTLISPSGKKRVLCTACNKTFCDKGALKIHYSAVHLKEMHKCSIEGCNMMFSSRRSRNRHSANPNPKLHMPQSARRKLPDCPPSVDEKSKPHPMPTSMQGLVSPSAVGQSTPDITMPALPAALGLMQTTSLMTSSSEAMPAMASITSIDRAPIVTVPADPGYFIDASGQIRHRLHNPVISLPTLPKVPKLDIDDTRPERDTSPPPPNLFPVHQDTQASAKESRSNRRKKCIPTRCTNLTEEFAMSDENSNDCGSFSRGAQNIKVDKACADSCTGDDEDDDDPSELDFSVEKPENDNEYSLQAKATADLDDDVDEDDLMEVHSDNEDDLTINESCSDGEDGRKSPSDSGLDDGEIPVDKENPNRCSACRKIFPNHFAVRAHYQNVHLKLMHICNVDGCNAAFPSKRSRDRHSSNLNLHRKLLSTSSANADPSKSRSMMNQSLRDEFLPRIYDSHHFQSNLFGQQGQQSGISASKDSKGDSVNNNNGYMSYNNVDHPKSNGHASEEDDDTLEQPTRARHSEIPTPAADGEVSEGENLPHPDPAGAALCHICQQSFRDNLILKEHFEKVHPREMYHCTIRGCDKIFSTRKSRNRHSQNDNLHRHLLSGKINGTA